MFNKKVIALIATAGLAACLALVGCGGGQAASSSAASSSAASSSAAASESAASASASSASAASASAAASSAAASASAASASAASAASAYIGDQAAMDIALQDAGFAAGDVIELEVELDLDDAVIHYDVNFKNGGYEYDYDIDATSGDIISHNSEVDD